MARLSESIPLPGETAGGEESRRCATPQARTPAPASGAGVALAVGVGIVAILGLVAAAVALRCWLF